MKTYEDGLRDAAAICKARAVACDQEAEGAYQNGVGNPPAAADAELLREVAAEILAVPR